MNRRRTSSPRLHGLEGRISPSIVPVGGEFRVNTWTTYHQWHPAVATDQTGDFVVAWDSQFQDGGGDGVYAQRSSSSGAAQGLEFRVNSYTTNNQNHAAMAMDQVGDFVVAWESYIQDGSYYGIYAQRFNSAGQPQGDEFRVNTYTTGNQYLPTVTMDRGGDCAAAWQTDSQDGYGYGVYAQAFRAGGAPDGGAFRVNMYTTYDQEAPAVAMDTPGDTIVAWQSVIQDGSNLGVYAQRYRYTPPRVSGTQINDGTPQRSRVASLTVTFSTQVIFAGTLGAAFTLTRNSDGAAVGFTATANVVGGATVVTLNNFTGAATNFTTLTDGRYTLTALASQISAGGGALDGNGDGIGGDNYVLVGSPANGLFRLFGDSDGNGIINAADFLAFRSTFGGASFAFDFDNSGAVDSGDFVAFRSRFGSSV